VLTGGVPAFSVPVMVQPGAASVDIAEQVPAMLGTLAPGSASLALTGGTPVANVPPVLTPGSATLTAAGQQPGRSQSFSLLPAGGTVALTGAVPVAVIPLRLTPVGAQVIITGNLGSIPSASALSGNFDYWLDGAPVLRPVEGGDFSYWLDGAVVV